MAGTFGSSGLALVVVGAGTAALGFFGERSMHNLTGMLPFSDGVLVVGGGAIAALGVSHMLANP